MSDSEDDVFNLSQDESDDYEPDAPKKVSKPKAVAKAPASASKPKAKAPSKEKPAKAPAKPKANGAAPTKRKISVSDAEEQDEDTAPPASKAQKTTHEYNETRTIEEIYQKKTPLEHILLRPDTYIGTTEMNQQSLWVLDQGATKFVNRSVNIVPGLYKIVDEIIVNAADNKIRDPTMDTIKINIDRELGEISVYNNGKGIPVEMHKKEGCYVPELIFGHLLTSSNYDDSQKKVTGGRNGYGAKLCNIFSTEFIVETADKTNGLTYKQVFSKNMSVTGKPKIAPMKKSEEFTKISFKPDFDRFGMDSIDDDLEALLKKRTYDLAGCVKGVKVFLNGERIKIKSFKEYIEMYLPEPVEGQEKPKLIYDSPNPRWEVACMPSSDQFQQVSFVNSISTSKGGVHVDYVTNQIVKELIDTVKKKSKSTNVKPFHIKSHMWVFINCLIENPAFDSQTKEHMTLKQSAFGSKCELSEKFIKDVIKSPIVEGIVNWAAVKDSLALKKTDGSSSRQRLIGIPKLEDAHNAGSKNGRNCTLILTEGDSAKSLVMAGFAQIGRDNYGVFPLRGKLLNVRDTPTATVLANKEIGYIKQILGLKQNKTYTRVDELRYGHLMIMTDQDHDGSHIKGLIINFLDHYFPSLLKIPGFLTEFITPIVRATKGNQKLNFFTIPEFEAWKEANDGGRGWTTKYFKGLGTSMNKDAKEYFENMNKHKKEFAPLTDEAAALIDMAFNKKKADERKEWLANFLPGTYLDNRIARIPIDDFINKELILFSMADNVRSIPSMVDGLKPGQRKVIFGAFKRKLTAEIKVAQFVGYVSEKSAYHHGEQSLASTIVGLAQDFVGSNNVNLLLPNGQFGSRVQGGKDAASPRYIYTALSPIARRIFHVHDDPLLTYLTDDDTKIEPEWYMPIIPMVLVNGSDGIGTGWSSNIPNYNPVDIIANIRRLMKGEEQVPMLPWYRGFTGPVVKESEHRYKISGVVEELDESTVRITELPIRTWTTPYKEQIETWITGTEKVPSWIKDFRDDSNQARVDLTVTLTQEQLRKAREEGLESKFKLASTVSTSNMVCFDPQGRIKRYSSAEEIVQDFFDLRLDYYRKRKEHLINLFTKQWMRLDNKVRFILMFISGELQINNRKEAFIIQDLRIKGFDPESRLDANIDPLADQDADGSKAKVDNEHDYDYLLDMPLRRLSHEKVEELKKQRDAKNAELKILIDKTAIDLWNEDLDDFTAAWEQRLEKDLEEAQQMTTKKSSKSSKSNSRATPAKPVSRKKVVKKVSDEDDDDAHVDNGDDNDDFAPKPKRAPVAKKISVKDEPVDVGGGFDFTPKPKRASAPKKSQLKEEDDEDDDDEFEPEPKPKRALSSKKIVIDDDDDDDFEEDEEEEDDFEVEEKPKRAPTKLKQGSITSFLNK